MKKQFSFYNAARIVVLLQYLLCATMALNLVAVYGFSECSTDHVFLLLLIVVAFTSRRLLKMAGSAVMGRKEISEA